MELAIRKSNKLMGIAMRCLAVLLRLKCTAAVHICTEIKIYGMFCAVTFLKLYAAVRTFERTDFTRPCLLRRG